MAWFGCSGGSQKEITLYEVGASATSNYTTIDKALTYVVNALNGVHGGYGTGFAMETKGLYSKLKFKTGNDSGQAWVYGLNKDSNGLYAVNLATKLFYENAPAKSTEFDEINISDYDAIFIITLSSNLRGFTWLKLYN